MKTKKKTILAVLLTLLWSLAGILPQGAAIDTIPENETVKIILSRPTHNEDNSLCDDLLGYFVYRSTTPGGPYSKLNTAPLPPSVDMFVDRHLLNDINYFYVGTSVDDVGNESQYSAEKMGRPSGDEEKPSAITDLSLTVSGGIVTLNWSFASDNEEIDHYTIYRDLTEIKDIYLSHKNTPSQVENLATVTAEITSFSDSNVNRGTIYYYVVTAFDKSGNEADSSNCESILVPGVDVTPPYLTSIDDDAGGLPRKGGDLITFIVIGESGCQATLDVGELASGLVMTETAQPGTYIYTYTVPADIDQTGIETTVTLKDVANNEAQKTADKTISIDNTPPAGVAGFTLTPLEVPDVKLTWIASGGDAHHYVVYRNSQPIDNDNKLLATVLAPDLPLEQIEFIDETSQAATNYYYAVGSKDLAGNETIVNSDLISIAADTVPPEIVLVTEDTMGATQKAGGEITITIIGEPGLTASFTIEALVENTPMVEEMVGMIPSGTYNGYYQVQPGDSVIEAIITGKLVDGAGLVTVKDAAGRINIVTDSSDNTPPAIDLVSHDAADVLVAGDILEVIIEGEAGGVAYADLGTMEKAVLLTEIADGVYSGTYKVVAGDNLKDASLVGHLVDSVGNESSGQASILININTNLTIEMSRGDSILVADGRSTTSITATAKDAQGNTVANEMVDFTLVGGDGQLVGTTSGRTNSSGELNTTYETGEIVITAFIAAETVSTGDVGITYVLTKKTISVDIALLDPSPRYKTSNNNGYAIEVFAKPHRITANGHSVSVITALVTLNGAPEEGVRVSFAIVRGVHGNEGYLTVKRENTDANGEAEAIYTSGTKTQLILIQATAFVPQGAPVSESTQVLLIAGGVKFLFMEADPNEILADGSSTSLIMVKAEDEFNNRVPGIKVEFSLARNYGTLNEPYEFTSEPTYPIQGDQQPAVGGGEASVIFTAGTTSGIETIMATVTSHTWGGAGNFFQEGLDNFAQGDYVNTIVKFELALEAGKEDNLGFVTDYTEENWTDDILFMLGYSYEMVENFTSALSSYDEVVNYYFGGTWADNAQYRIGQSYEKDGNIPQAIISYQAVINNFRAVAFDERNLKDNAQFRLGRCYEKSGYVVLARSAYERLINYYPDSALVDDAQAAIERLSQP